LRQTITGHHRDPEAARREALKAHYAKAADAGASKPAPAKEKSGLEKEKDALKSTLKSELKSLTLSPPASTQSKGTGGQAQPRPDFAELEAEFFKDAPSPDKMERQLEMSEYFKE